MSRDLMILGCYQTGHPFGELLPLWGDGVFVAALLEWA